MSKLISNSLSQKVQQLRQARGLTQQQLAQAAEVSLSTVSKIEEGAVTRPSARVLLKLVKSLNFDLDQLLSEGPLPAHLLPTGGPETTPSKIKFVYCDIGGVLLHTDVPLLQNLSVLYNRPLDKIRVLHYQYVPIACKGKLSLEDLQVLYLLKLNIKYTHKQKPKFFKHWVDYSEPIEPMQMLLAEIARKYPVGLLTDTVEGFVEKMKARQLLPQLRYQAIVKSCDVGVTKPDARIYEIAAAKARVKPAEILFIDDKMINVEAAKASGWAAEWFDEYRPELSIERIRRQYL